MSFHKVYRKDHHLRAERLEARFSPIWTGQGDQTAGPVPAPATPNTPVATPATSPKPVVPAQAPPPASSVPPTQTPAAITPAVIPTTTPVVTPSTTPAIAPPVVPTTTSPSPLVVPTTIPSSSASAVVQTTPTIVATPTVKPSSMFTGLTTFRSLPLDSFTPTRTMSASPSATSAAAASGMGTGSIIGITAAGVAGVAVVGALGMWLLKRYFQSRDSGDASGSEFQRHSWMRHSVALADDVPSPIHRGPSPNPRPPTMIERQQTRNYANVAASRGGYPQDPNGGMAYSGYQDSPYGTHGVLSFSPGQHLSSPSPNSAQPFFSPIGSPSQPASPGMASFDDTMPAMQHASYNATGAPVYFSRHDSNMSDAQPDSAALPAMPNPHESRATDADGYATLDRTSVTPYQAAQYAEITRQLQNHQVPATIAESEPPRHIEQGYAVQEQGSSPFEDPAQEYPDLTPPAPAHARIDSTPPSLPPMRAMSPVGAVGAHSSFAQLTSAFPAAPISPVQPTFPAAVASSPKSSSFKQAPPLSPIVGPQKGQVVSVPENVHIGRETPVQFGFNNPAPEAKAARRISVAPSAKRMSMASRKSGRPDTMYDEEDAYGGI